MKRFVFLHYGFETPTPEIMSAWNAWFEETAAQTRDKGHFSHGLELSAGGKTDLPFGPDSMTGFNIIEAEDLEAAEAIARRNPFVSSIRVYEVRDG